MQRPSALFSTVWLATFMTAGCSDADEGSLTMSSSSTGMMVADPCDDVHGCTRATALDFTGEAEDDVYVAFSSSGYEPACIRIRPGMRVTFNSIKASFQDVPIQGGIFPDPDPMSPIQTPFDGTAMVATFQLSAGCAFPYYSPSDGAELQGVVFLGGL